MRDCDGWACRPEQNQQVALKSTVNLAVTRGEGAKKSQNEPIKQLTARIDALNNMVDALQHTIAAQVERGCQCLASQPVSSKVSHSQCCPKCTGEGRQDCPHCFICSEEGHPGSWMLEMTSAAGKWEPATAEGQPVTAERMFQTDAANPMLYRPGGRKAIDQRCTNQIQNDDSTDDSTNRNV